MQQCVPKQKYLLQKHNADAIRAGGQAQATALWQTLLVVLLEAWVQGSMGSMGGDGYGGTGTGGQAILKNWRTGKYGCSKIRRMFYQVDYGHHYGG